MFFLPPRPGIQQRPICWLLSSSSWDVLLCSVSLGPSYSARATGGVITSSLTVMGSLWRLHVHWRKWEGSKRQWWRFRKGLTKKTSTNKKSTDPLLGADLQSFFFLAKPGSYLSSQQNRILFSSMPIWLKTVTARMPVLFCWKETEASWGNH